MLTLQHTCNAACLDFEYLRYNGFSVFLRAFDGDPFVTNLLSSGPTKKKKIKKKQEEIPPAIPVKGKRLHPMMYTYTWPFLLFYQFTGNKAQ